MISVLIASRNRPKQLDRCLRSLAKCKHKNFEIILVDQGNSDITKNILSKFPFLAITHLQCTYGGKGAALNKGLKSTRGTIIAFTDDDCVVDKYWLSRIERYFHAHPDIAGLFGKTLPYKSQLHKGLVCRTVFTKNIPFTTRNPYIIHYKKLGIGNNMIFRRSVINKIGGFKEWLGVGSVSQAGGIEGEFIYRALKNKCTLAYEPTIIVYHDKWLTEEQEEILQTKYIIGTTAFYCYYIWLARDTKLLPNLIDLRFHITNKLITIVKQFSHGKLPRQTIKYLCLDLQSFYLGISLGLKQAGGGKNT
jgi:glycosyltransferase involved in cell wall biosynthesis